MKDKFFYVNWFESSKFDTWVILLGLNLRLIWLFFLFHRQRQSWAIENDSKYNIFCVFSLNCFIFVDLHFINCVSVYICQISNQLVKFRRYKLLCSLRLELHYCAENDKNVLLSTFVKLCIVNIRQWYNLRFSRYVAVKHAVCGLLVYFICSNGSKLK